MDHDPLNLIWDTAANPGICFIQLVLEKQGLSSMQDAYNSNNQDDGMCQHITACLLELNI